MNDPERPHPQPDEGDSLPLPEEESDDTPGENEPLDKDLPCLRCGYNLRGLKADGNCPECGARVRKALNFAMERILCLACMCPVHPSMAICPNCRTPMHGAGDLASYWQTKAHGVSRKAPMEAPPERPFPWGLVAWFFGAPLAAYCFVVSAYCIVVSFSSTTSFPTGARDSVTARTLAFGLMMAVLGMALLTPAILLTRLQRQRMTRLAARQQESASEVSPETGTLTTSDATSAEILPPLPPSPRAIWMICILIAGVCLALAAFAGTGEPTLMVLSLIVAALTFVPAIGATQRYNRLWHNRQRQIAARLKSGGSA